MSLVSKDALRDMARRMVPRTAPTDAPRTEQQRVAEQKLQTDARRMLKEMLHQ